MSAKRTLWYVEFTTLGSAVNLAARIKLERPSTKARAKRILLLQIPLAENVQIKAPFSAGTT